MNDLYRPPTETFNTARTKGGTFAVKTYTFAVKPMKFKDKGMRTAETVEDFLNKAKDADSKIKSVSSRDWPPPPSWRETGKVNPREFIGEPEPGVLVALENGEWDGWIVTDWNSMQDVMNMFQSIRRGNKIKAITREGQIIIVTTGD